MGFFKPNLEKMKANKDVKGLIKALMDKDEEVRKRAAIALGEIGDARRRVATALPRRYTIEIIGDIGDVKAVEPLIKALKDEDVGVRASAAVALGKIGDVRAVGPLAQAVTDKDEFVRLGAVIALGEIGDARAVEPLFQALQDENEGVRLFAAGALKELERKVQKAAKQALKKLKTKKS